MNKSPTTSIPVNVKYIPCAVNASNNLDVKRPKMMVTIHVIREAAAIPVSVMISAAYSHRIGPIENSKNATKNKVNTIIAVVLSIIANIPRSSNDIPIAICPQIKRNFLPSLVRRGIAVIAAAQLTTPTSIVPIFPECSESYPTFPLVKMSPE